MEKKGDAVSGRSSLLGRVEKSKVLYSQLGLPRLHHFLLPLPLPNVMTTKLQFYLGGLLPLDPKWNRGSRKGFATAPWICQLA